MAQDPESVEDVVHRVDEVAEGTSTVSVGDAVDAFGYRAYGPLLLVPALLEISPLGAVPTVPTILASIVAIFAIQIAIGRKKLWLPAALRNLHVSAERLEKADKKIMPWARRLDKWFHQRLTNLTGEKSTRIAAVCCLILCLTIPPLELLPFASAAPMAAVAVFGLAMTARDGLLMLAGFVLTVAALTLGTYLTVTAI